MMEINISFLLVACITIEDKQEVTYSIRCEKKIALSLTVSKTKIIFILYFQPALVRQSLLLHAHALRLETHVVRKNNVHYPRVSPATHRLTKRPEDSGNEIV